ncbi:MAG TPA: transglutaminase family protein [Hyphomicrobium sp.]|nr:transglutaminase family protein [Hyphomicrobium sp.]
MRIAIGHVSRYTYAEPVQYAVQNLRLTPPSFNGQRVIEWLITAPGFERAQKYRDSFGNICHLVSCSEPHGENLVLAKGVVETSDRAGLIQGLFETTPARVYKRVTPMTKASEAIVELAHRACPSPNINGFHRLMNAVRDALDYKVGATHEQTTASDAFAAGSGVCQDHAHVFIAAARALGVPARYVSGYFVSGDDEPAEAHHAWAEVWIDGLGWVGFDAANRLCPTDHYVRLATGLDADSAAPIRGTRRGGGTNELLDVIVEVQQQMSTQQ